MLIRPPVVSEQPRRRAEGTLLKYIAGDGDRLPDLVATISELPHCPTFAALGAVVVLECPSRVKGGKAGSEPIPSGLPPKADIVDAFWHFRFVPEADMGHGN